MGRDGAAARAELTVTAVRARGLAARFGDRVALEGFDLDVAPGEIVGLLGPNGAGKTTALRLLATGRRPSSGTLILHGLDPAHDRRRVRRRTGVAGDEAVHLESLTGWENGIGFAMACGLARLDAGRRVEAMFETFGLTAEAHRPVAEYSLGMRRKLLLVEALVHVPALIVLDEPTGGLDPDARAILAEVLRHRTAAGAAVVLATHDLPSATALCDRVLFLRSGRTVLEGRPAELIARLGGATRYEFSIAASRAPEVRVEGVEIALASAARLVAHSVVNGGAGERGSGGATSQSALPRLCEAIQRAGATIDAVSVRRPDLGDVFLKATGEELAR